MFGKKIAMTQNWLLAGKLVFVALQEGKNRLDLSVCEATLYQKWPLRAAILDVRFHYLLPSVKVPPPILVPPPETAHGNAVDAA